MTTAKRWAAFGHLALRTRRPQRPHGLAATRLASCNRQHPAGTRSTTHRLPRRRPSRQGLLGERPLGRSALSSTTGTLIMCHNTCRSQASKGAPARHGHRQIPQTSCCLRRARARATGRDLRWTARRPAGRRGRTHECAGRPRDDRTVAAEGDRSVEFAPAHRRSCLWLLVPYPFSSVTPLGRETGRSPSVVRLGTGELLAEDLGCPDLSRLVVLSGLSVDADIFLGILSPLGSTAPSAAATSVSAARRIRPAPAAPDAGKHRTLTK